ncbi:MAG: 50S ribosomal protein L30e [Nitrososphaeria archaeon]|nr:50S ribosomal protein L30e [Aigarchaeota archaeon]MCX8187997.1 50S ribosomal protein L30e [Nitrososphaeria archaeon]MDW8021146.1 50S ribosomal protein L30e [Nitrososphaerota archaeon]
MAEEGRATEVKDLKRHFEVIARTGKMILGFRQSYLSVINRKAKLVILAGNCPPNLEKEMIVACKMTGIPCIKVNIPGIELGYMIGRPFSAAVISILDPGSSNILEQIVPREEEAY